LLLRSGSDFEVVLNCSLEAGRLKSRILQIALSLTNELNRSFSTLAAGGGHRRRPQRGGRVVDVANGGGLQPGLEEADHRAEEGAGQKRRGKMAAFYRELGRNFAPTLHMYSVRLFIFHAGMKTRFINCPKALFTCLEKHSCQDHSQNFLINLPPKAKII
jgi:hypothetical protein